MSQGNTSCSGNPSFYSRYLRYPGVACDVPSHAYQFTFENNTQWSRYWASGPEIQAYLKHTAIKYGADRYMKFRHFCEKAEWVESEAKWHVTFKELDTNEVLLAVTSKDLVAANA